MSRTLLLLSLLSFSSPAAALAGYDRGEKVRVPLSEIKPTQFAVGLREVELRRKKLEALKEDAKALKELMKDYRASVVVGPGKKLYLIDGHHFARTLHEAGIKKIYIRIERDWSDESPSEFWSKMRKKGWVYLKDQAGTIRKPSELPSHIGKLSDDPYRSLAWFVRKAGGYENLTTPFQEFRWADFFRERISPSLLTDEQGLQEALDQGLKLARSKEASKLPGFLGKDAPIRCTLKTLLRKVSR